eukprot:CAMPEP_0196574150 /NCGR_PEP_ID=MMETSP1081-20130531/3926_1 /TAXON_ID=36882 /ORGANISM="Pyramimonas amylifera, Strain CCMP720" /LENGTH=496 /DNA_ID=CAMNT_0041892089 /DNA_START=329 /DNA_END=1819 /DNA_ORIENTATION=-
MGAHVSNWVLAGAVAGQGQLGMVSGVAMDSILARTLQTGDPGGHYRRALAHFPDPSVAQEILDKYFQEAAEGPDPLIPFKPLEMYTLNPSDTLLRLTVAANFCEVWLAKEGLQGSSAGEGNGGSSTGGMVGINLLTKIELPTLPSLYGAMLAGVDTVLMGAGIPRSIPEVLNLLSQHENASIPVYVEGAEGFGQFTAEFSPKELFPSASFLSTPLHRPLFMPIVSSTVLAKSLIKSAGDGVNGFVVEMPKAGGHNAPPRGKMQLDTHGEPVYGTKDEVSLADFAKLGRPFWVAGGFGRPGRLGEVQREGAQGIQVGTLFAFSRESGFAHEVKQQIWDEVRDHDLGVFTDPRVSPTGFPFKVVQMEGTLSEDTHYESRPRSCSLGYLRVPYVDAKGKVGYKCASEPIPLYQKKGGKAEDTEGRKCLCNGLLANVGLGNVMRMSDGTKERERFLVTAGDDVNYIRKFLKAKPTDGSDNFEDGYSALDVIDYLLKDDQA